MSGPEDAFTGRPDEPGRGDPFWVCWRFQQAHVATVARLPVRAIINEIAGMDTSLLREVITYGIATFEPKAIVAWNNLLARALAGQGDGSPLADDEDDRRLGVAMVMCHREGSNADRMDRWRRAVEP